MTLSDAFKTMAKRSKLTYKIWAERFNSATTSVITSPITRNDAMVSTLIKLANAAGYDVLLVRRHMLEYEEPIVIDKAGKNERDGRYQNVLRGDAETADNRKEGN